jgi:hypothetical protein
VHLRQAGMRKSPFLPFCRILNPLSTIL